MSFPFSCCSVPSQPTSGPCIDPFDPTAVRVYGSTWNRLQLETIEAKPYADIILVVDESGSMVDARLWLPKFIRDLERGLEQNSIGNGAMKNRYGLIGFGIRGRPISLKGNGYMGSSEDIILGVRRLRSGGLLEDGYDALSRAFDPRNYQWRPEAGKLVVLVTNEDRDRFNYMLNRERIYRMFNQSGAVLSAVVNMRIYVKGAQVLGVSKKNSYAMSPFGNITFTRLDSTPQYVPTRSSGNTKYQYMDLAMMTGGDAWDVNELRLGSEKQNAFTAVIVRVRALSCSALRIGCWKRVRDLCHVLLRGRRQLSTFFFKRTMFVWGGGGVGACSFRRKIGIKFFFGLGSTSISVRRAQQRWPGAGRANATRG